MRQLHIQTLVGLWTGLLHPTWELVNVRFIIGNAATAEFAVLKLLY